MLFTFKTTAMLDSYTPRSRNSRTIVAFVFNLRLLTIDIPIPRITNSRGNADSPLSTVARLPSLRLGCPSLQVYRGYVSTDVVSILLSQHSHTFPLSFSHSFAMSQAAASEVRTTPIRVFLITLPPLLVCIRGEDTSILALLAASAPSPGILSDANETLVQYQFFFISIRASHLHVSHLLLRRRNKHAVLSKRRLATSASRDADRSSLLGTGATQARIAVIVLSGDAKEYRVDEGLRHAVIASSHLAFASCAPLSPCTPRPTASQEMRIPRCYPITLPPSSSLSSPSHVRTRESDLPVAAERPSCLHSALAMPWLARSTAAAHRGSPFFSPAGRISRDAQCRAHPSGPALTRASLTTYFCVKPPCALLHTIVIIFISDGL